jgi:hypothetical protein
MLARKLCVALLAGLVATAALAQPPPPKLGTRAFTEKAVDDLHKAAADYKALNDQNSMDVEALDRAFNQWVGAMEKFDDAARAERETYADVKAAKEAEAVAASTYKRAKGGAYDVEERARLAHERSVTALHKARDAAEAKIEKALGESLYQGIGTTEHHQKLQHIRYDEQQAAIAKQRKAEAEKKAKDSQAKQTKSGCARGGGAAGALEQLACQENHAGAGH